MKLAILKCKILTVFYSRRSMFPPTAPGLPEVVADVLEALGQLLHAGEGLLLLQRRGARLLPWPRHVVDREVAGDEAEAGTNQK